MKFSCILSNLFTALLDVDGFREINSIRSHLPRQLSATLRRSAISCSLGELNRSRCLRTAKPITFHGFCWSTESSSLFGCDLFLGHRLNGPLTTSLTEGTGDSWRQTACHKFRRRLIVPTAGSNRPNCCLCSWPPQQKCQCSDGSSGICFFSLDGRKHRRHSPGPTYVGTDFSTCSI